MNENMDKRSRGSSLDRMTKTPQRRNLKKPSDSKSDTNVLLLHYGVIISPHRKRRNDHLNRGRNISASVKSWRRHKSISPCKNGFSQTLDNSPNKSMENHHRRQHISGCDVGDDRKKDKKHDDDESIRHHSPMRCDIQFQEYVRDFSDDAILDVNRDYMIPDVRYESSTESHNFNISTPGITETREELLLRIEEAHRQEITDLKDSHQHYVDQLRDSYHQREKEKDIVLRQLDHEIKTLRQEIDLLKLSSMQSLDSVRSSIESQCKALLCYVQNEISESRHEMELERDIIAQTTSPRQVIIPQANRLQSPVPTLQSWQSFTQRFRKAISGEEWITEHWDDDVVVNALSFVEEFSFSSLETYYDAECNLN